MKWISIFIWLFFWAALLFSQPAQAPDSIFKNGVSAYKQGNYDLSYQCFSQAINMDPNRNYFYYNRGMTLAAMGNNTQAVADFKKSLDLQTTAEAYYQLGMLAYQRNDMVEAKTELENAHALREDLGSMNFFLGLIYFKDKQYDDGYKCFQACTEHNKTNAEAYYYQGFCAAQLGLKSEAIQSLKYAAVYNSTDWRYYMKMYQVYKVLGDVQNSLNNISMVIELGEHKPAYYASRAELYKATGQETLAEEDTKMIEKLKASASTGDDEDK